MLDRLRGTDAQVAVLGQLDAAALDECFAGLDCIVDGLFGSGLSRPLEGPGLEAALRVNGSSSRVISLDLPSGLASDRGELLGEAVRAEVTLAMAFLKPAHLLHPASALCGNVAVLPVAYPLEVLAAVCPWGRVPEQAGVARRLPARRPDGHKGTFGRVAVVAGSAGMTGAAILTCRGALRAGAGIVTLGAPCSLRPVLQTALPEAIVESLPEQEGRLAGLDGAFLTALEGADVLAVGPGLTRGGGVGETVRDLLSQFSGPIVLDADGITAFQGRLDQLQALGSRLLLTPHPGEMGILLDRAAREIDVDRAETARRFGRDSKNVLLLKGRPSIIGTPEGELFLNPTGNTGLSTGGSGDVLTGLIAGFVAGGANLVDAAILGAYLHGWAAETFARRRSERALTPSDLLDLLPTVLREAEEWS
jgi:NAD(P)H-hydrate epimerase